MDVISNRGELIRNSSEPALAELALAAIEEGIRSVEPRALIRKNVEASGGKLKIAGKEAKRGGKLYVVGAGKASGAMAEELEKIVRVDEGHVNVPKGTAKNFKTREIELCEAGHPIPDEGTVSGAEPVTQGSEYATLGWFVESLRDKTHIYVPHPPLRDKCG